MKSPYVFPGLLIQEQLPTGWHILVAAILLNQSRRSVKWDTTLSTLFERWATPQSLADADESLEELLAPHGFKNVKANRLRRMSSDYTLWDHQDPQSMYGVGSYAADSYRIFVRGERPDPETVKDGALVKFLKQEWTVEELSIRRSMGLLSGVL